MSRLGVYMIVKDESPVPPVASALTCVLLPGNEALFVDSDALYLAGMG